LMARVENEAILIPITHRLNEAESPGYTTSNSCDALLASISKTKPRELAASNPNK